MSTPPTGFMAIWKHIADADETDYLHWLTREHVFERVGVPGFLSGRVFRNIDLVPREYFILYDLRAHDVLASAPYLERLNQPTPWSQRAMKMMRNFVRGGGSVRADAGNGEGGTLAVLRFDAQWPAALQGAPADELVRSLTAGDKVSRVRVLETAAQATSIQTNEKQLRSGDETYRGLLLIEALDLATAQASATHAAQTLAAAGVADLPAPRFYTPTFAARAAA